MIPPSELKKWRELCGAAESGPWESNRCEGGYAISFQASEPEPDVNYDGQQPMHSKGIYGWGVFRERESEFIAEARTALPRLVDEVERLRGALTVIYGYEEDRNTDWAVDPMDFCTLRDLYIAHVDIARSALGEEDS